MKEEAIEKKQQNLIPVARASHHNKHKIKYMYLYLYIKKSRELILIKSRATL